MLRFNHNLIIYDGSKSSLVPKLDKKYNMNIFECFEEINDTTMCFLKGYDKTEMKTLVYLDWRNADSEDFDKLLDILKSYDIKFNKIIREYTCDDTIFRQIMRKIPINTQVCNIIKCPKTIDGCLFRSMDSIRGKM